MDGPITDAPQFGHFVQWVFYVLLGVCGVTIVATLRGILSSIVELNTKVAVLLERQAIHDKQFDRHERQFERHDERLSKLETKQP